MPRQARLDAQGTLHHVILRGIERGQMVAALEDRESFLAPALRLESWGTPSELLLSVNNIPHY